jgi:hypothetical protein
MLVGMSGPVVLPSEQLTLRDLGQVAVELQPWRLVGLPTGRLARRFLRRGRCLGFDCRKLSSLAADRKKAQPMDSIPTDAEAAHHCSPGTRRSLLNVHVVRAGGVARGVEIPTRATCEIRAGRERCPSAGSHPPALPCMDLLMSSLLRHRHPWARRADTAVQVQERMPGLGVTQRTADVEESKNDCHRVSLNAAYARGL